MSCHEILEQTKLSSHRGCGRTGTGVSLERPPEGLHLGSGQNGLWKAQWTPRQRWDSVHLGSNTHGWESAFGDYCIFSLRSWERPSVEGTRCAVGKSWRGAEPWATVFLCNLLCDAGPCVVTPAAGTSWTQRQAGRRIFTGGPVCTFG